MDTYRKLCSFFYDADKPTAPTDALDFYLHYARKARGKILEPMCGTGRFLLPMLEEGLKVEGFDASDHMFEILLQKLGDKKLHDKVCKATIRSFNWQDGKYQLIFVPSGSFGLLTEEKEIIYFLEKSFQSLSKDGLLIFDAETLHSAPTNIGIWKGRSINLSNNQTIVLSTLDLPLEDNVGSTICRYDLVEDGTIANTEIETIKVKLHDPKALSSLIGEIGFTEVRALKAYKHGESPVSNDDLIVYECMK